MNNNNNNKTFTARISSFLKKSFASPKINVEPYVPKSTPLTTTRDIWTLENVWSPMNIDIDDKFKLWWGGLNSVGVEMKKTRINENIAWHENVINVLMTQPELFSSECEEEEEELNVEEVEEAFRIQDEVEEFNYEEDEEFELEFSRISFIN